MTSIDKVIGRRDVLPESCPLALLVLVAGVQRLKVHHLSLELGAHLSQLLYLL